MFSRGEVQVTLFLGFLCILAPLMFVCYLTQSWSLSFCSIPWYLTVKLMYGAEVTSELRPLWVIGPVITAVYIKIIQGLCSLYFYLFMQAIHLIKNLPTYSLAVYNFIAKGEFKKYVVRFWEPVECIKKLDYKALLKQKFEELKEWAVEKYLDYVESIWPYYCRTIRFLKKAHLI